jgi:hypothetical protein
VSSTGDPLLVVLDGLPGFFLEPGAARSVIGVVVLAGLGTAGVPRGVRGIEQSGSELHVLTGPVGRGDKRGAIELDHPGSCDAPVEHSVLPAAWLGADVTPSDHSRAFVVEPKRVRRFDPEQAVEGLSRLPDGGWAYIVDADGRLRLGLAPAPARVRQHGARSPASP